MAVYVDMDGVLADLFAGFKHIAGYELSQEQENLVGKKAFWEPIENARPGFWSGLPKMVGADRLLDRCLEIYGEVHILSARFKSHDECEAEKREWLDQWLDQVKAENVHIVVRKEKKDFAVDENGMPNLLIDDLRGNCEEWYEAGGVAIQYQDVDQVMTLLDYIP